MFHFNSVHLLTRIIYFLQVTVSILFFTCWNLFDEFSAHWWCANLALVLLRKFNWISNISNGWNTKQKLNLVWTFYNWFFFLPRPNRFKMEWRRTTMILFRQQSKYTTVHTDSGIYYLCLINNETINDNVVIVVDDNDIIRDPWLSLSLSISFIIIIISLA